MSQAQRTKRVGALSRVSGVTDPYPHVLTLEAIEDLTAQGKGRPPTYRELAAARRMTVGGIQYSLDVLAQAKLLSYQKGVPRSLEVLDSVTEEWVPAGRLLLHREQTRTTKSIGEAIEALVDETLDRVDLDGSEVEIIIRHKP